MTPSIITVVTVLSGRLPSTPSRRGPTPAARTLAPWRAVFPGLAVFLAVMGFNLLGDGLRDAFDPRAR